MKGKTHMTGYDSPVGEDLSEDAGDFTYTVSRQTIASHDPRPCAVILRDGLAFGYIPCDSEEEFEWLRTRLSGTRPRS